MAYDGIIIEKVWSYPESFAFFLEKCAICIQIRNKSGRPIEIEKIECHFQTDDGAEPFIPIVTPRLIINHNHLSRHIRIEFEADLAFKANTNNYCVSVHYVCDNLNNTLRYDPRKYLIFTKPAHEEKSFFISHKDPEDSGLARQLAHFLNKLGFIGYLSEDYRRPGIDLWEEKIPSAIAASVAMIILWTNKAEKNPENIYREIEIAKSCGKQLIMAREKGIEGPPDFPKGKEYYLVQHPVATTVLKNLACSIEEEYRRGGYTK